MENTVALTGLLVLFVVAAATLLFAYIADEEAANRRHETWVDWGPAEAGMPTPA